MGWFSSGPDIRERSRGGRVEFYGKCDECGTEKSHAEKKRVQRLLEDCAKKDKKEAERKAERELRDEAAKLKRKLATRAKELRRMEKGKKCPFCGKQPCKGTKPKCAQVKAREFENAADLDMSDPATFDEQLRWYRDNM
jgi:hypothetical protein